MQRSDIEDAAMFLLHLRTQRKQVAALPHELAPATIEQGYDIQDALHHYAGWPIDVLKVGCTSEAAQAALGIPHPAGGRIPAEGRFSSGATIERSFFGAAPLLECELALRVAADGSVDAVAPAVELVDSRFRDIGRVRGPSLVADNSAASGVVLGSPVELADAGDLDAAAVSLTVDHGTVIATGSGAALLDGPHFSVAWTLAHEVARGRTVAGGTWIITGTCTGLTPAEFGSSYTADFGPLGNVSFTLRR